MHFIKMCEKSKIYNFKEHRVIEQLDFYSRNICRPIQIYTAQYFQLIDINTIFTKKKHYKYYYLSCTYT